MADDAGKGPGFAAGTVYLMGAQVAVFLSSYLIHIGLGRMWDAALYGTLGVILALLNIGQIFVLNGMPQAMSKYIAEGRDVAATRNQAAKAQGVLSLALFAVYFAAAPVFAGLLNDPGLTPYIRLSSLFFPLRAMAGAYGGVMSGLRQFSKLAIVTTIYSVLRVIATFALVALGLTIAGAIFGYLAAAFLGFIILFYWAIQYKGGEGKLSMRTLAAFAAPTIVFAFSYTIIMNLDLLFVKSLQPDPVQTGLYTTAWAVGQLPFFIFFVLSATLLPVISHSISKGNPEATRSYIRSSMRYLVMMLVPVALLISATAPRLVPLLYGAEYAGGGAPLAILIFGITFLTAFVTLAAVMMGSGKPKVVMLIGLCLLPLDAGLNYLLIPRLGLPGAATATTVTCLAGMALAAIMVYRQHKALMPPPSMARLAVAGVPLYFIAWYAPVSGVLLIPMYLALLGLYLGLLVAIREWGKADTEFVKKLVGQIMRRG